MGITDPTRLWSRDEITARPSPVPATPGVYGAGTSRSLAVRNSLVWMSLRILLCVLALTVIEVSQTVAVVVDPIAALGWRVEAQVEIRQRL